MSNDIKWKIRENRKNPTFAYLYGSEFNTTYTSLEIYHGGKFTPTPGRDCIDKKVAIVDYVAVRRLSHGLLSEIVKALDYKGTPYFYAFAAKEFGLDLGLVRLESENDFENFKNIIYPLTCNKLHRVYVEGNWVSHVASFSYSLRKANPRVIEKMLLEFLAYHPFANLDQARNYVFDKYHVWITPFYLSPGFDLARSQMGRINSDC